ncbi:MAG: dephospho-CoA kinase [Rikenellaceae bacterium]
MKILGVTGGIGSGKSTLCKLLVEYASAQLYCADLKARELMNSHQWLRGSIVEAFGEGCYSGGELNRAYLAGVVFGCEERLQQLNSIVHPVVRDDFRRWVEQCDCDIVILESAILFESGFDDLTQIKVAVLAPTSLRVERVCRRDSLSSQEVMKRIEAQMSDDELQGRADMCVVNIFEEDLEASAQRIAKMVERWQE